MSSPTVRRIPGAHIADPGPLGLAAFALTTFVLSCVTANIVSGAAESAVFGLALAYGGIAQFVAGLFEFAKGNTFGATAFCSYGAFWVAFWYLTGHTSPAPSDKGVGLFLLGFGIFTLYMTVATLRINGALLAVFALLTITFFLLAFGAMNGTTGLTKTGGWFGLATAIVAWYTSFAGVLASTFGKPVLPVFPLSSPTDPTDELT